MKIGASGWVHSKALVSDTETGLVYLIEDSSWNVPPPRFAGPGASDRRTHVTRTAFGYVTFNTSVSCIPLTSKRFGALQFESAVPMFVQQGSQPAHLLMLKDKLPIGPGNFLTYTLSKTSIFHLRDLLHRAMADLNTICDFKSHSWCEQDTFAHSTEVDEKTSGQRLVKWIRKDGEPLLFGRKPNYLENENQDEKLFISKDFDPSEKSCSGGFHMLPLDGAIDFLLEIGMINRLPDLALMICKLPTGTHVRFAKGVLSSKIRVSRFERNAVESKSLKEIALPRLDEKNAFQVEISSASSMGSLSLDKKDLLRLAYWLSASSCCQSTSPQVVSLWKERLEKWVVK